MRLREYAQLAGGCTQEGHAADRFSAGSVRQATRRS
jgi:hypothetical protein